MSEAPEQAAAEAAPPATSHSSTRKWLGRIAYVVFLLVFVEVSLQVFYYVMVGGSLLARTSSPVYVQDKHSVYRNRPNSDRVHRTTEFNAKYYTNSEGHRVRSPGIEYAKEKDPSKYRILLMGPSFAFGASVDYDESFGGLLETMLQEADYADGKQIELINAGVPSLGPARQLNWYKHVGKDYHPDLVIQFTYGSMNVNPDPDLDSVEVTEDGYRIIKGATTADKIRGYAKKSAIVFYAWMLIAKAKSNMAANQPAEGAEILGTGQDTRLYTTFKPDGEEVAVSLQYYDDFKRTVEASGARPLIVYFPLSYCVHREDVARWTHLGVRDVDEQIQYNAEFAKFIRERGLECLDITPDLVAAAEHERLYFWLDIHWTVAGNRVMASSVVRELLAEKAAAN